MTVRTGIGDIALAAIKQELPGLRATLRKKLASRIASKVILYVSAKSAMNEKMLRELNGREQAIARREARMNAHIGQQEIHRGEAQQD